MDKKTIDLYNANSTEFARKHASLTPVRLYDLAKTFFLTAGKTLDLGCGIGRDTKWLNEQGYPTEGYDASSGMLEEARKTSPKSNFVVRTLPELGVEEAFENIFCSAVLMHIPRPQLVSAVISILKALKADGRLIISFKGKVTERDERLCEIYHPGQVAQLFESLGGKVLHIEKDGIWDTLVVEKQNLSKREGIQLIQDIITRDKKVATYKFALIRALCEISRYEAHVVTWYREADMVLVPMQRIAARWILYYWPLVNAGLKQTTSERLAFEENLRSLPFKPADMVFLKNALDNVTDKQVRGTLRKVSNTIKVGPVQYAGGGKFDIFSYVSGLDASVYPELKNSENGMVTVPIKLWRDICLFSHWIEDSLSIQWAELSTKINRDSNFGKHLDLITRSIQMDERDTYEIRKLFKNKKINCVWTGRALDEFAVDHMIPWALWRNNDLWNLLPSDPKVNLKKRDFMPSPKFVAKRFDAIHAYWELYQEKFPDLFSWQVQKGLGVSGKSKSESLEALEQTLLRVNLSQGGSFWE